MSVVRFGYISQSTDNRNQEPRTKSQEQRLFSANLEFTAFFILHTSDNRQLNQEPRSKNKDCLVLIEIFFFFQTSTKVISCQLSVIRLGTLAIQQTTGTKNQDQRTKTV